MNNVIQKLNQNVEIIKVENLTPYERNYNKHPDAQVDEIAISIETYGFLNPVLIDADNNIVAGHGRHLAAIKLGLDEIPALRAKDLTDAQRRAYLIADNQIARHSKIDTTLLSEELVTLQEDDEIDLFTLGFSDKELADLLPKEFGGSGNEKENKPKEKKDKTVECPECGNTFNPNDNWLD